MGDWLVIIGAAAMVTAAAVMFGDLLELRDRRGDPEAVAAQMERGVIGNRWVRLGVQVIVTAGLVLISIGVVIGV